MPDRPQPYAAALLDHVRSIAKPGQVIVVDVLHDHDCPRLRGGKCQCQPEVELLNRAERRARRKAARRGTNV